MLVTYAVAGAFASACALLAMNHPSMPYWWCWDRAWMITLLVPLAAIFAAAGVGVVALVEHFDLPLIEDGAGKDWANGLIYGFVAYALLRLEINGVGFEVLSPARNLLKLYSKRMTPSMDRAAFKSVRRKIGELDVVGLCSVALDLCRQYVLPSSDIGAKTLPAHAQKLAALQIVALDPATRTDPVALQAALDAQACLRRYCVGLIRKHEDCRRLPEDVPASASPP